MSTLTFPVSIVNKSHIESFRKDGYMVLSRAVPVDVLEQIRGESQYFIDQADAEMDRLGVDHLGISYKNNRYFISQKAEERKAMVDFLYSPLMADVCRATLGPDVWLFHEQWVIKAASKGMKFSWHQDSGYVGHEHAPYLTCWIPLDDATEANGTIYVLPFSKHPETRQILKHVPDAATNDLVGYHGDDPGVAVECPAGSIVAFSSRLFHRSGPNTTNRMRRVYLPQYSKEIIRSADGTRLAGRANPFLKGGKIVSDHAQEA